MKCRCSKYISIIKQEHLTIYNTNSKSSLSARFFTSTQKLKIIKILPNSIKTVLKNPVPRLILNTQKLFPRNYPTSFKLHKENVTTFHTHQLLTKQIFSLICIQPAGFLNSAVIEGKNN